MKNKVINLFLCECKNQGCGHSFYTSSSEYTKCPNCDEESLQYSSAIKAEILPDEENTAVLNLIDEVKSFFKEKSLFLPLSIDLKMDYEYDPEPWEYLENVTIQGDYANKADLKQELKDFINDNFSIQQMKDNKHIEFKPGRRFINIDKGSDEYGCVYREFDFDGFTIYAVNEPTFHLDSYNICSLAEISESEYNEILSANNTGNHELESELTKNTLFKAENTLYNGLLEFNDGYVSIYDKTLESSISISSLNELANSLREDSEYYTDDILISIYFYLKTGQRMIPADEISFCLERDIVGRDSIDGISCIDSAPTLLDNPYDYVDTLDMKQQQSLIAKYIRQILAKL